MNIKAYIQDSIETKTKILNNKEIILTIKKITDDIVLCYKHGNKVLIAGNGGSAGDAQHFAGELVSKCMYDRRGLSAMSLSTDTSILTAISNDYGYDQVFMRQLQANGKEGDIFIGISTSGKSKNIVLAMEEARKMGMVTVGLTGSNTSLLDNLCDHLIKIPSSLTPIVQESHIMLEHIICAQVEEIIFDK